MLKENSAQFYKYFPDKTLIDYPQLFRKTLGDYTAYINQIYHHLCGGKQWLQHHVVIFFFTGEREAGQMWPEDGWSLITGGKTF